MAKSPVPARGSRARSISNGSERLARVWPRIAGIRIASRLLARGGSRHVECLDVRCRGGDAVGPLERLPEQVLRLQLGKAHERRVVAGAWPLHRLADAQIHHAHQEIASDTVGLRAIAG